MKIACISDTHGLFLPEIPEGVEIVLHAGDVGPDRNSLEWLKGPFKDWAADLNKRNIGIFATFGNHDFIGERLKWLRDYDVTSEEIGPNVNFFVDQAAMIANSLDEEDDSPDMEVLKVWFSPWSPTFGNWAFMESEEALALRYSEIPDDVDIIVNHSPPRGFGDRTDGRYGPPANVGSTALLDAFEGHPTAKYLICGHIHAGAGIYTLPAKNGGLVKQVVNCAQVDEEYQPVDNAVRIIETFPKVQDEDY